MKKKIAVVLVLCVTLVAALVFTGCNTSVLTGELVINSDKTGSREFQISFTKSNTDDGYGEAYKYLKIHGNALKTYFEDAYGDAGLTDFTVTVAEDDTKETVKLKFTFTDISNYFEKLKKMAQVGGAALPASFPAPVLTVETDSLTYFESKELSSAILKAMVNMFMDDADVFDLSAGGTNTNQEVGGGMSSDLAGMKAFACELGEITVKIGSLTETYNLKNKDIDYAAKNWTTPLTFEKPEPKLVAHYAFEDNLNDSSSQGKNLTKGDESSGGEFATGVSGKGYKFDGTTYLKGATNILAKEYTVSFYYKADAWTDTDTGANIVLVCAGLDALSPGAVDIGFLVSPDEDNNPVYAYLKANGSNWQIQDNAKSETYFNNRLNEWHHYAYVFETEYDESGAEVTGMLKMYVDGNLLYEMEQYNSLGLDLLMGSENSYNIGGYLEADLVKRGLTGTLDELKIYTGALAEDDVLALYNSTYITAPYDAEDKSNTTLTPPKTDDDKGKGKGCNSMAVAPVGILALAAVAVLLKKRHH